MIVLSKTSDVGRDHLIHRKRSPFPYEGKALTRLKVGMTFLDELRFSLVTGHWSLFVENPNLNIARR